VVLYSRVTRAVNTLGSIRQDPRFHKGGTGFGANLAAVRLIPVHRRLLTQFGDRMTVLAFDVGGTRVKAALVADGRLLSPVVTTESCCDGAGDDLLARVVALGRELTTATRAEAVGVSIRGVVDTHAGVLVDVNPPLTALIGKPLGDHLARELGAPAVLDNDARMHALGELHYGLARSAENLVCVTLGTGVGTGVIVGRRLLRGRRGVGGILGGHFTVDVDGPRCGCGNTGCLETLIGAPAFTAGVDVALRAGRGSVLREALSPERIFAAADAGDALAADAVARFTQVLGCGVVNMIHAYDPDIVVIGGGLSRSSRSFLPQVRAYVNEHAWTQPRGRVPVEVSELGDGAALLGAAVLAAQAVDDWHAVRKETN
jgi:glucokinase